MTTGMPELGSKISLISKADIRYEGRLFTVDPQECTIALASVRSFGTEDRETQYPVPAQNQVYDYILFRGSDIKDIRVITNVTHPQPLNDPAIMQLSVPPSLGGQPFQGHPVLGPMAPQMSQFAGAYAGMGAMGGLGSTALGGLPGSARMGSGGKPSELILGPPPQTAASVLLPPSDAAQAVNSHDLIGGSRSSTPASLSSRKSPTNDQGVQAGGGGAKHDEKKVVKPIQPPGQRNQPQRKRSRERRPSRGEEGQQPNRQGVPRNQQGYYSNQGNHQGGGFPSRAIKGVITPTRAIKGATRGGTRIVSKATVVVAAAAAIRTTRATKGEPNNQGNVRPRNTLKFDNDYDFEQANTEFEELRSQLGKLKVDEASSVSTKSEVNGDVDKKDDSGNETGAGEPEQEEETEVYYDKTKSFFDKISCEAVERAKGKSQRTDWRVERKLNSETFGVSATRRGHYRGRGGYRGMGYRGGYRNNYRQPQQRRDQQHQQQPSSRRRRNNSSNKSIRRSTEKTKHLTWGRKGGIWQRVRERVTVRRKRDL
ncbi:hypothetical protein JTB14_006217 [Gonioctena quinquepunctata]|nr:hypothetical protein JTB14_006217 [Gonioctena quinquepunctata]